MAEQQYIYVAAAPAAVVATPASYASYGTYTQQPETAYVQQGYATVPAVAGTTYAVPGFQYETQAQFQQAAQALVAQNTLQAEYGQTSYGSAEAYLPATGLYAAQPGTQQVSYIQQQPGGQQATMVYNAQGQLTAVQQTAIPGMAGAQQQYIQVSQQQVGQQITGLPPGYTAQPAIQQAIGATQYATVQQGSVYATGQPQIITGLQTQPLGAYAVAYATQQTGAAGAQSLIAAQQAVYGTQAVAQAQQQSYAIQQQPQQQQQFSDSSQYYQQAAVQQALAYAHAAQQQGQATVVAGGTSYLTGVAGSQLQQVQQQQQQSLGAQVVAIGTAQPQAQQIYLGSPGTSIVGGGSSVGFTSNASSVRGQNVVGGTVNPLQYSSQVNSRGQGSTSRGYIGDIDESSTLRNINDGGTTIIRDRDFNSLQQQQSQQQQSIRSGGMVQQELSNGLESMGAGMSVNLGSGMGRGLGGGIGASLSGSLGGGMSNNRSNSLGGESLGSMQNSNNFSGGGIDRSRGQISGMLNNNINRDNSNQNLELQQFPDTIFIRDLPEETTEEMLIQHFGTVGKLKLDTRTGKPRVTLVKDKITMRPRGEATLGYQDVEFAQMAIKLFNNKDFRGKRIRVEVASRKMPAPQPSSPQVNIVRKSRPGDNVLDWTCPDLSCRNQNFSWRNECNRCKGIRPDGLGDSSISGVPENNIPNKMMMMMPQDGTGENFRSNPQNSSGPNMGMGNQGGRNSIGDGPMMMGHPLMGGASGPPIGMMNNGSGPRMGNPMMNQMPRGPPGGPMEPPHHMNNMNPRMTHPGSTGGGSMFNNQQMMGGGGPNHPNNNNNNNDNGPPMGPPGGFNQNFNGPNGNSNYNGPNNNNNFGGGPNNRNNGGPLSMRGSGPMSGNMGGGPMGGNMGGGPMGGGPMGGGMNNPNMPLGGIRGRMGGPGGMGMGGAPPLGMMMGGGGGGGLPGGPIRGGIRGRQDRRIGRPY